MKIRKLDRSTVKDLRPKVQEALKALEALGLNVQVGNASFSSTSVTFKVELAIVSEGGAIQSKAAETFKRLAYLYGLRPDDLGKTYGPYTVVGLNPRAKKYPIVARRKDGKDYKIPAEMIVMYKSKEVSA